MESDDELEDIGEVGALKDNARTFAAKLADETEFPLRLVESSFSCGTDIHLIFDVIISFKVTLLIQYIYIFSLKKKKTKQTIELLIIDFQGLPFNYKRKPLRTQLECTS